MISALWAALLLQAAAPPAQPAAPTVLRAGTPIRFVTEAAIDSRSVRQGQRFAIVVAEDLVDGSRVLIPKGTKAVGEVEAVSGKGMFGKPGSLSLRPLFIEIGDQRINLEGAAEEVGKEQVGGAAIATVLTGGLGLVITGKSARLDAGSPLTGWVRNDATISPHQ